MSRRAWIGGLILGSLCIVGGLWGYYAEERDFQVPLAAVTYFWLPLAAVLCMLASAGHRQWAFLAAVVLLDVEAALLGAGPLVSLPFVVAVPLIGVAVSARLVTGPGLRLPYVAAWIASSVGVSFAVFRTLDIAYPSSIIIIPAFALVEAVALLLLWHLDAGRLRALAAVVEAEARVLDLLNGVDLLGVHVNRDSRIDFINEFALKVTGWQRRELLGADWWDTFATADRRDAARAHFERVVSGAISMEAQRESTIQTHSGEKLLIRWSHVTRHDSAGRVTGVASLGRDVTAIRIVEEERRRATELLSTLVVSSPLPTVVVGMDRIVQMWNPAAVALLGWPEAEVRGSRLPEMFGERSRSSFDGRFAEAISGRPFEGELMDLRHRDGAAVRVRLFGAALRDGEGRPIAIAIQGLDVTTAMEFEEQLREAHKMEAVGRLAGGVAHDFNNSLTAIGGFASMIVKGTREDDTREAAETILSAAKHSADLTRELLAYSRRSLLQPQTIDVNELLAAIQPMLRPLLGEDVAVVLEARVPHATVRVDPSGLQRVILNLAANARDAMPGGGRLTISTDRRSRSVGDVDAYADGLVSAAATVEDGEWVVISVSDTGLGIPFELHSQVFDPFFTTKPVGAGTGLGLAMVKGFVVQSGGQVVLRSEPGAGTTIEILLPAAAQSYPGEGEPPKPGPADGAGETVLVVEDEAAVAALSFQVLSRRGYRVLLADSGESAIALLGAHTGRISLLLIDVILPDMRGPQVAEFARALHPEAAVLFASGYSAEEMSRTGELAPGVDLIEKPFAPEELLARVKDSINAGCEAVVEPRPGPTDPA